MGALGEARRPKISTVSHCAMCLSARFLRYAEPSIHLLPRAAAEPSFCRRLSLCSLPVPKQVRGPEEFALLCPAVKVRDLADCAPSDLFSFFLSAAVLSGCAAVIHHKHPFATIDCEQVRDQLTCDRKRGSIAVASLRFFFIEQRQIGI